MLVLRTLKHDLQSQKTYLKQDFICDSDQQRLAYDFTYIPVLDDVTYLCVVEDFARVVSLAGQPAKQIDTKVGPGRVRSSDSLRRRLRANRPQRSWIALRKPGVSPEAPKAFVQASMSS